MGLVKLKNAEIREKLGSGWVAQAPTRFFSCVFCVFILNMFKKNELGVGGCVLANSSFSRIFFNLTGPLTGRCLISSV